MMYRKFGYLQARILLDRQDQLRDWEVKLAELDEELEAKRPAFTRTRDIIDPNLKQKQASLINSIAEAYCSYC